MQIENDYFYQYNEFWHILVFVILIKKFFHALLVLVILKNNICLYLIDLNQF